MVQELIKKIDNLLKNEGIYKYCYQCGSKMILRWKREWFGYKYSIDNGELLWRVESFCDKKIKFDYHYPQSIIYNVKTSEKKEVEKYLIDKGFTFKQNKKINISFMKIFWNTIKFGLAISIVWLAFGWLIKDIINFLIYR